jgi:hypothetical protein
MSVNFRTLYWTYLRLQTNYNNFIMYYHCHKEVAKGFLSWTGLYDGKDLFAQIRHIEEFVTADVQAKRYRRMLYTRDR